VASPKRLLRRWSSALKQEHHNAPHGENENISTRMYQVSGRMHLLAIDLEAGSKGVPMPRPNLYMSTPALMDLHTTMFSI
jgi:hypothetical protein